MRFRSSAGFVRSQSAFGTIPNIPPPSSRNGPPLTIVISMSPSWRDVIVGSYPQMSQMDTDEGTIAFSYLRPSATSADNFPLLLGYYGRASLRVWRGSRLGAGDDRSPAGAERDERGAARPAAGDAGRAGARAAAGRGHPDRGGGARVHG